MAATGVIRKSLVLAFIVGVVAGTPIPEENAQAITQGVKVPALGEHPITNIQSPASEVQSPASNIPSSASELINKPGEQAAAHNPTSEQSGLPLIPIIGYLKPAGTEEEPQPILGYINPAEKSPEGQTEPINERFRRNLFLGGGLYGGSFGLGYGGFNNLGFGGYNGGLYGGYPVGGYGSGYPYYNYGGLSRYGGIGYGGLYG